MFWVIGITVLATSLILVLLQNFKTPDKVVEHRFEHHYAVSDPQFRREMSVLLGPAIAHGNQVTALHNGNEIFPAMLQAFARRRHRSRSRPIFTGQEKLVKSSHKRFLNGLARAYLSAVSVLIDWVGSTKMKQSGTLHFVTLPSAPLTRGDVSQKTFFSECSGLSSQTDFWQ